MLNAPTTHTPRVMDADTRYTLLAAEWCRWNGQRGTDKQIARIKATCTADELDRMLRQRGRFVISIGNLY